MQLRLPQPASNKIDLALLSVVVVFLYLMMFRLPFTPIFAESDPLIFLYNADRMLSGEVLYRDFFQFTFPGGQVLYYFLFSVFGPQYWILGFATIAMGAASFWFCIKVSKYLIAGPLAYLPPLVFIFFGMRWFGLDGSHRTFSPIFVLIAVLILLKGSGKYHLLAAGIFCSLASFFTQDRGIVAVAGLSIFVAIDGLAARREWKAVFGRFCLLFGSFAVSLFLLCSYYIFRVGLGEFIDSTIVYPALYYQYFEHNNYSAFAAGIRDAFDYPGLGGKFYIVPTLFYSFVIPISILFFPLIYWRDRKLQNWEYWRRPALISIVSACLVLGITAPNNYRYFNISALPLILTVWSVSYLNLVRSRGKVVTFVLAALLIAFGFLQAFRVQYNWPYIKIDTPRGAVAGTRNPTTEKYIWLLNNTEPGEYAYEVGLPYIYFPLGLRNPTRYSHILQTSYTPPQHVAGAVTGLKLKKPRFIIWQNAYHNITNAARAEDDSTGPLAEYILSNYFLVKTFNDDAATEIWKRNE